MEPPVGATHSNVSRIITASLLILSFSGCATVQTVTVPTRHELLSKKELTEKDCYTYDTQKNRLTRNLKTALPLGIISFLMGPIGPFVAGIGGGVAMQAEQTMLPTKCGLTIDDAERQAVVMAFNEDTPVVWYRVKDESKLALRATPTGENGQCSLQSLEITRTADNGPTRMFSRTVEVCKNKNGDLVLEGLKQRPNATPGAIYAKETAVENKKNVPPSIVR